MLFHRNISSICVLSILTTIFLIYTSCNEKDIEEPDFHMGWHESMTGKIVFTEMIPSIGSEFESLFVIDKEIKKEIKVPGTFPGFNGIDISSDGLTIAYATEFSVSITNINGDNQNNLIDLYGKSPTWSPDGTKIAFLAPGIDIGYNSGMVIVAFEIDSGSLEHIFHTPYGLEGIDWSSSENTILHHPIDSLLYLFDLAAGQRHKIYHNGGKSMCAKWSPDCSKIAIYCRYATLYNKIVIINPDGTGEEEIFNLLDDNNFSTLFDLAWSPDGEMIALGTTDGIYVIDLDGTIITKIETQGNYCRNIDWQ